MIAALFCLVLLQEPKPPAPSTPAQRIEAELAAKLELGEFQTTTGTDEAIGAAIKAYQREIARVYAKLMKGLPPSERAALVASQKAWKRYETAEMDSIRLIDLRDGTIHRMSSAYAAKDLYAHRLEELNARFEDYSDDEVETMPDAESQPVTLDEWKKSHDRRHRPGLESR